MTLKTILLALGLLPTFREDVRESPEKQEQLVTIGSAVLAQTSDPEIAAFVLAWGYSETRYGMRFGSSDCRRWECDARKRNGAVVHLARGYWQAHRIGADDEAWEALRTDVNAQAARAVRHARWALAKCGTAGDERVLGAFHLLAGKRCDATLPDDAARLATFKRVRRALP